MKKSVPTVTAMWARMKSFQVVFCFRFGAGGIADCLIRDLVARLAMAPTIRSYPQLGFSHAVRTMTRSISVSTGGRPTDLRNFDPSNLLAISFRYQANSVSGLATAATSFSALRPSR